MAYENLKTAIKQAIKQNGNQEITGSIMQSTLLSIADNMHEVAQESGEADDKVMSQKAITAAIADEKNRAKAAEQANTIAINAAVSKNEELEEKQGIYNVDANVPLSSGQFYTPTTARIAVTTSIRKLGLIITYKIDATTSIIEQFIGSSISDWGTNSNWKKVGSDGGNKILEWNTDVNTTRKSVPQKERKAGMQISYLSPTDGWINEQYLSTIFTDTEWVKNANWKRISYDLVDINTGLCQDVDLSANYDSWENGCLAANGEVYREYKGRTSDFVEVVPGGTIIRFVGTMGLSSSSPNVLGYDINKSVLRVLFSGGSAENGTKPSYIFIPHDVYYVRLSSMSPISKRAEFSKISLETIITNNISENVIKPLDNKKADIISGLESYVLSRSEYEIENNKYIGQSYSIQNLKGYSVIYVPIPSGTNNIFLLGEFERSSFYTYGFFADENKTLIEGGKAGYSLSSEINGGYINYRQYKSAMGKEASYLIFSTKTEYLDRSGIIFGDYTPLIDVSKTINAITDYKSKCNTDNLVDDFGLNTEIGIAGLDGNWKDNRIEGTYNAVSIKNFIYEEDDELCRGLGISRCVKYKAGENIHEYKLDTFRQSYQIRVNRTIAKGSQFKCLIIVGIDDEHADFIDNLKISAVNVSMNLSTPFNISSEKSKRYKYKLKDNLYLVCAYFTCQGAYTETYFKMDAELYGADIRFYTTDLSHDISFHGGWVFAAAWEKNTVRDYSMPTIEDLTERNSILQVVGQVPNKQNKLWLNKSVLAVGTSYMHPNSRLAEKTQNKLGFILQNNGNVGGSTIGVVGTQELVEGNPPTDWKIGLSLTNKELNKAYELGITNDSWMSTNLLGYENLIMKWICGDEGYTDSTGALLKRPDWFPQPKVMIVLDGQNDSNQKADPREFTDRSTWRGAWNYILTEIYKVNSDLKVIFLSNPGITGERGYEGLTLYEANKMVVEQWNLPYVDFVTQLGVINDYRKGDITTYTKDWGGNHYQDRCAERMAQILAGYLNGIIF
jgi:hypothetical protein|nr:MAG TPA: rhamnogalacturan/acetylesterase-like protein [Caudoviricetes sp.]